MERLTVTTLDKLQTGDRFYKLKDKNKTVHEVLSLDYDKWDKIISASVIPVDTRNDIFTKRTTGKPQEFAVVFLRSPDDEILNKLRADENVQVSDTTEA